MSGAEGAPMAADPAIWTERLELRPCAGADEGSVRRFFEGGLGIFLARERAGGRPVGFAGFRPFREPPVLELLYGLHPAWWGRGLATEKGRAMLALAFDRHGLDAPNPVSIRVRRRLGLAEVGRSPKAFGEPLHFRLERADRDRAGSRGSGRKSTRGAD